MTNTVYRWFAVGLFVALSGYPAEAGTKVVRGFARALYVVRGQTTIAAGACDCAQAVCTGDDPIIVCGASGQTADGQAISPNVSFGAIGPFEDQHEGCGACACNTSQTDSILLTPEGACLSLAGRPRPAATAAPAASPRRY